MKNVKKNMREEFVIFKEQKSGQCEREKVV